ncbi:DNA topoisomerase IB [Ralstonia sp. R-29]|uniref:DNA topoisomerase IB n=1 Tax=Ralstonia sp. R-29 TaxID=3404059 RepID=UPI003CE72A16
MERAPEPAPAPAATCLPAALDALPEALRYVDDTRPGYTRRRLRGRFVYFDTRGERIRDPAVIARINKLAIPPAYTDVWICPHASGHLQATGRDARGRKQYRYHAHWRAFRDADKYSRLLAFGAVLPRVREAITAQLAAPGLSRKKMLATVIYLLDVTLVRVGNAAYARENRSYGLTTLRNRHVEVRGNTVRFHFRGKSGVEHDVSVSDPRLARIIRRCVDLPGQELFQYIDEAGERRAVDSADVNAYLQTITGADFTAKDYRTWAGSVLALDLLRGRTSSSATDARRQVVEAIAAVAQRLGNTPAVCRKCYVHPAVIDAFLAGELTALPPARARKGLRREEAALLRFLERAAQTAGEKKPA